jgi:hypothetical protein
MAGKQALRLMSGWGDDNMIPLRIGSWRIFAKMPRRTVSDFVNVVLE